MVGLGRAEAVLHWVDPACPVVVVAVAAVAAAFDVAIVAVAASALFADRQNPQQPCEVHQADVVSAATSYAAVVARHCFVVAIDLDLTCVAEAFVAAVAVVLIYQA